MSQSIESTTETTQILSEFEQLSAQVKGLANKELTKLQKMIADELCRRAEQAGKTPKKAAKAAVEKSESAEAEPKVKGETPIHLRQNREWTAYVRDHSRANGWPAFTWNKDATTKVPMPQGVSDNNGAYVYPDLPESHNKFTDAHAMSLAAELREANDAVWTNWESSIYQPTDAEIAKRANAAPAKPKAPKANTRAEMTFAAYVASIEQKAAEEKAKKERVAEREQKKATKAAEKPAEKKVSKKAAAASATVPAAPVAATATCSSADLEEKTAIVLPSRKKTPKAPAKQSEAERIRAAWVKPEEGQAKKYFYQDADGKEVECLRDDQDGILAANGTDWIGQLNADGVTVDTTASNPYADVEESEDDE